MLVSIIIIKLIINLILLFLFLRLCFKTENLFSAQFDKLEKCI